MDYRRSVEFYPLKTSYAEGAVLVKAGKTEVYCTASIEESVPGWLKNTQTGWIMAEYAMLPRATHTRTRRERDKVSGRTMEIQRLIGRALRHTVDLKLLGERTIFIDCDVLQADGGTRTMAINGGCLAVHLALDSLIKNKALSLSVRKNFVAAISVGYYQNRILVDLCYEEDSQVDVDANFIFNDALACIEVQAASERLPYTKEVLDQMYLQAQQKCTQILEQQKKFYDSYLRN